MVGPTRRTTLLGLLACSFFAERASAETIVDITWKDLIPVGDRALPANILTIVPHDEGAMPASQLRSSGVRTDWNGQTVRLSGFVVPIDYQGTGVTAFILVPFVGACVHVPPPPANQLVFVTTSTPYELAGLFDPVTVTGMFGTASTSTQLAEIGYALSADTVRLYRP